MKHLWDLKGVLVQVCFLLRNSNHRYATFSTSTQVFQKDLTGVSRERSSGAVKVCNPAWPSGFQKDAARWVCLTQMFQCCQNRNFQERKCFICIFATRPFSMFRALVLRQQDVARCDVPWVMSAIACSLQVNSSVVKSWIEHCAVKPGVLLTLLLISVWGHRNIHLQVGEPLCSCRSVLKTHLWGCVQRLCKLQVIFGLHLENNRFKLHDE